MTYENIWAPWRLGYILGEEKAAEPSPPSELPGDADPGCFLCCAAASGDDDRRRLVVARTRRTVTVLNRFPYNNGHLLVAPRRHVERLDGLDEDEQAEIAAELARVVSRLERTLKPDGFNVGLNLGRVGGAGLPGHLHWHVVPRWLGDTNFMPTLAGVRVIPQSLEALWELLGADGPAPDKPDAG